MALFSPLWRPRPSSFLCDTFSALFIRSYASCSLFSPQVVTSYPWLPTGNKEADSVRPAWWPCPLFYSSFCLPAAFSHSSQTRYSFESWLKVSRGRKGQSCGEMCYMYEWPPKCSTKCYLGLCCLSCTKALTQKTPDGLFCLRQCVFFLRHIQIFCLSKGTNISLWLLSETLNCPFVWQTASSCLMSIAQQAVQKFDCKHHQKHH